MSLTRTLVKRFSSSLWSGIGNLERMLARTLCVLGKSTGGGVSALQLWEFPIFHTGINIIYNYITSRTLHFNCHRHFTKHTLTRNKLHHSSSWNWNQTACIETFCPLFQTKSTRHAQKGKQPNAYDRQCFCHLLENSVN